MVCHTSNAALAHIPENRKVEARKPLTFQETVCEFYLEKATFRQSPSHCRNHEWYSPFQSAMCKRWDTREKSQRAHTRRHCGGAQFGMKSMNRVPLAALTAVIDLIPVKPGTFS